MEHESTAQLVRASTIEPGDIIDEGGKPFIVGHGNNPASPFGRKTAYEAQSRRFINDAGDVKYRFIDELVSVRRVLKDVTIELSLPIADAQCLAAGWGAPKRRASTTSFEHRNQAYRKIAAQIGEVRGVQSKRLEIVNVYSIMVGDVINLPDAEAFKVNFLSTTASVVRLSTGKLVRYRASWEKVERVAPVLPVSASVVLTRDEAVALAAASTVGVGSYAEAVRNAARAAIDKARSF